MMIDDHDIDSSLSSFNQLTDNSKDIFDIELVTGIDIEHAHEYS
jgi:hypothetical protein